MRHQKYILNVGFKDSNRDKQLAYKIYYSQRFEVKSKKVVLPFFTRSFPF